MGSEETPGMKTVLVMRETGWPLKVNWTQTARVMVGQSATQTIVDVVAPVRKSEVTKPVAASRHERRAREAETKKLERRMSKVKK